MDYQFVKNTKYRRPRVLEEYEFNEDVRVGCGSYGQVYKARKKSSTNSMEFYALKEVELTSYSPSTCREIAVRISIKISLFKHLNIPKLLFVSFFGF